MTPKQQYLALLVWILLGATLILGVRCSIQSAPAPLPQRRTFKVPQHLAGRWILTWNDTEWTVDLTDESRWGGDYRAERDGVVWVGRWNRIRWDDCFAVYEKPEGHPGPYQNEFPVRYDGVEWKITSGEDTGRGTEWRWKSAGCRVRMRRVFW